MHGRTANDEARPGRWRRPAAPRVLTASLGVGLIVIGVLAFDAATSTAAPVCSAQTCTVIFPFTGAIAEWEVPQGVSSATFVVEGAGGGGAGGSGSTAAGGAGASVTSTLQLSPGSTLELLVGGGGAGSGAGAGAAGGFGGGGAAAGATRNGGAGGGGGSFVFESGGAPLIVAAGGGGAATFAEGGAGGHPGADGLANGSGSLIGHGATEIGPGGGGAGAVNGTAGTGPATSPLAPGGGGPSSAAPRSGGGGGGGYYGGGSGASEGEFASAGAGGGSDFVAGGRSASYAPGPSGGEPAHDGHPGQITITYRQPASAPTPAPTPTPTPTPSSTGPSGPAGSANATVASRALGESVLTLLTDAPQPLINARALTFLSSCGPVACNVSILATVKLPDGRSWRLSSRPVALAADTPGAVGLPIPARLRSGVRSYLIHHPRFKVRIDVVFTASAPGVTAVSQHLHLNVPIRTPPHSR